MEASKRMVDETKRLYSTFLIKPIPEKQLARPSFNFIQDLVKSLITDTRILRDVFTPADFDTKRRQWNTPMKIDFVQKIIDFVARNKHPVVGCTASRVVAGRDPNKTLELLQGLAKVARQKLSANDEKRPRTTTIRSSQSENLGSAQSSSTSARPIANRLSTSSAGQPFDSSKSLRQQPSKTPHDSRQKSTSKQRDSKRVEPQPRVTGQRFGTTDLSSGADEQESNRTRQSFQSISSAAFVGQEKITLAQTSDKISKAVPNMGVNYNLQHLRANLRSLKSNLDDIYTLEESLKAALTMTMSQ